MQLCVVGLMVLVGCTDTRPPSIEPLINSADVGPPRISVAGSIATPTGVKLDGKYTGVAGSGDLVADFVPADHQDSWHAWEPALSF